jgi:soluble lytic murein transglycosylase-like protein
MPRPLIIPAVLVGCLLVFWISTVAAAQMPTEAIFPAVLSDSVKPPVAHTSKSAESDQASHCSLPASFPPSIQQWCLAIEASAHKTGLPANLIAAVMLQESGGDPLAYSSSGAVGLLQVMPRDGKAAEFMCINGPCFSTRPTIAELEQPEFNLAYGSQMLANFYAKHGSYREALFRYGPMDMGYRYADLVLAIWENYQ